MDVLYTNMSCSWNWLNTLDVSNLYRSKSDCITLMENIYFDTEKNKISGINAGKNGWWYTDFGLPRFVHPNSRIERKIDWNTNNCQEYEQNWQKNNGAKENFENAFHKW